MNISYLIYTAERPRSATEQREADVRAGELAAAVVRLGHSLRHPVTGKRGARRPSTTTVSCAIPRPRQAAER
jgi:hypothetical protein